MRKLKALIAVCILVTGAAAFAAEPKQMSVTVKTTQVRATPGYLGKVLGELKYGDSVTILEQPADAPKDWRKILGPDKKLEGWVNSSALTQKEIVLKSGSGQVSQSASSGDVALAGKGFNSDVEKQYKENEHLDYTWVDRMEAFQVTPQQVTAFLTQGGLTGQGGAQ
jgi:uncharacterized protein YgiM (DUF1202 family)